LGDDADTLLNGCENHTEECDDDAEKPITVEDVIAFLTSDLKDIRIGKFRKYCISRYCRDGNSEEFFRLRDKIVIDSLDKIPSFVDLADILISDRLFGNALVGGKLDIIKAVHEHNSHYLDGYVSEDLMEIPIKQDNLEVFEYLVVHIISSGLYKPPPVYLISMALRWDAIKILLWLAKYPWGPSKKQALIQPQKMPWPSNYNEKMLTFCSIPTIAKLTDPKGPSPIILHKNDSVLIAGTKRIDVLEWMFDTYVEGYFDESPLLWKTAISQGQTDTILWLKTRFGYILDHTAYHSAILNNSVAEMEQLYSAGVPLDDTLFSLTSEEYEHRDLFRWLISKQAKPLKLKRDYLEGLEKNLDFEILELVTLIIRSNPDVISSPLLCLGNVLHMWNRRKMYSSQCRIDGEGFPMTSVLQKKPDGSFYNFENVIDIVEWGFTNSVFIVHPNAIRKAIQCDMLDVVKKMYASGFKWEKSTPVSKSAYQFSVKYTGIGSEMSKYLKEVEETEYRKITQVMPKKKSKSTPP